MKTGRKIYRLSALFFFLVCGCTTSSNTGHVLTLTNTETIRRYPIDNDRLKVFSDSVRPVNGEAAAKYDLARHFQHIGKHRIAIEVLGEVVRMDPSHADAHNAMGFSYDCLGDYRSAQDHYRMAIVIDPGMDHAYNNLGYSSILDGQYAAAIEAIKQAIQLNDANDKYHKNLGLAYFKKGDHEMAAAAFREIKDPEKADQILARLGMASSFGPSHDNGATATSPPVAPSADGQKTAHRQPAAPAPTIRTAMPAIAPLPEAPGVTADGLNPVPASVEASAAMTALPAVIPGLDGIDALDPESHVEISNGNGVRRMARTVGDYLAEKGVNVFRLTNADHFNHEKTVIYYRNGFYPQAARIQRLLPGLSDTGHLVAVDPGREPIRILIGRDLVPFKPHAEAVVSVDLTNGNGVNGMARRVGRYLLKEGFRVGRLTNADHFGYKKTTVFYSRGRADHAKHVAAALPGNGESQLVELNNQEARIQILLGADMVF